MMKNYENLDFDAVAGTLARGHIIKKFKMEWDDLLERRSLVVAVHRAPSNLGTSKFSEAFNNLLAMFSALESWCWRTLREWNWKQ